MQHHFNSSYADKRVLVVGCHSGIGHATARLLLDCGAQVYGLDWKPCDLALAGFAQADLRSRESIDLAAATHQSPLDALFNCAGIPPGAPPMDVVTVNYIGTRYLTDRLLPLMQAGSAIVNVASTGGMAWPHHLADLRALVELDGFDAATQWCAARPELITEGYRFSKEAMIAWTMIHSASLIRRGIRMNCTLPGAVQTPLLEEIEKVTPSAVIDQVAQPIGRRSSADEQAQVLAFLGSDAAGYVNGAVLPVDGGFMASIAVR